MYMCVCVALQCVATVATQPTEEPGTRQAHLRGAALGKSAMCCSDLQGQLSVDARTVRRHEQCLPPAIPSPSRPSLPSSAPPRRREGEP